MGPLAEWIDAREREGTAYAVLGDFNREFYSTPKDEVWSQLNDADPAGLELWSPTAHVVPNVGKAAIRISSITWCSELACASSLRPPASKNYSTTRLRSLATCPIIARSPSISILPGNERKRPLPFPRKRLFLRQHPNKHPPIRISSRATSPTTKEALPPAGMPSYATTKIEPAHGERWFKTEPEARAAGWTKAPNCP